MGTRQHPLTPDPRGDYRPYIGVRADGAKQRFNLGKDLRHAEVSVRRIRSLYQESAAVRMSYGQPASWTAAKLIQSGLEQIPLPPASVVNEATGDGRKIGGFLCDWADDDPHALLWSHALAAKQSLR